MELSDHISAACFADGKIKAWRGAVGCDLFGASEGQVLGSPQGPYYPKAQEQLGAQLSWTGSFSAIATALDSHKIASESP